MSLENLLKIGQLRGCNEITVAVCPPIHPDWLRCSSLTYLRVCALLAPRHSGDSPVIFATVISLRPLKRHPPDREEIQRLLSAARRNLADAAVQTVSPETRFDAAYKAVMQAALSAMMANGYRPDTHQPGHHMTIIQSLPLTLGMSSRRVVVLDALRRQRNVSDYLGDDVDDGVVVHCITEAENLLRDVDEQIQVAVRPRFPPRMAAKNHDAAGMQHGDDPADRFINAALGKHGPIV